MTCLSRLAMVLLVAASAATASDNENDRRSLKGLKALNVAVEDLKPEVEQGGLNKTSIQSDVELKLRQAGIAVLTKAEMRATPGAPYLYINVSTHSGSLYSVSITVELCQAVRLDRDPSLWLPDATTWSVMGVGVVGQDKLPELRDGIKHYIDQFISAYLSVNPRK